MANRFQAKIKLGNMKRAPLSHVGFRGRVLKKGESFTTTSPEEAAYYQAQPGFSVTIQKGKLTGAPKPSRQREPDPPEADEESDEDEEEDEREEEVDGAYEKADLKKMKRDDLIALIDDDEDLPLSSEDLPKKVGKKEIIEAILEAQAGGDEDDEEDDDEEDED